MPGNGQRWKYHSTSCNHHQTLYYDVTCNGKQLIMTMPQALLLHATQLVHIILRLMQLSLHFS